MSFPASDNNTDDNSDLKRKVAQVQLLRKRIKVDPEKNPVQQFNEMYPGVRFEFVAEGPVHEPTFITKATVDGLEFTGIGHSKAKAKHDLAANVFSHIVNNNIKNNNIVNNHDATSSNGTDAFAMMADGTDLVVAKRQPSKNPQPVIDCEKAKCYPVMALIELFPDMQITWVDGVGRGDKQFRVESDIHGRRFFGEGRSKKVAKVNLAKTILVCMYDVRDLIETTESRKSSESDGGSEAEVPFKKKFPLTQLKEIVGEVQYDVKQIQDPENVGACSNGTTGISDTAGTPGTGTTGTGTTYICTIVVRGEQYSAAGDNKKIAKLRCAKKALEVFKPLIESTKKDEEAS